MTGGYYNVQIIYKAGFETRVYAQNGTDAFARALAELEMSGDFLDVISNHVEAEWEPSAIMRKANETIRDRSKNREPSKVACSRKRRKHTSDDK